MLAEPVRASVAMTEFKRVTAAPVSELATEFMVPMRDGVRLATDVYLPGGDQTPGPTVLTRLPYDKNGEYTFMPLIAEFMVRRGYRVVVQDVRGKYRSEGETIFVVNEAYDGYDTLDWIVRQPWSDGIVGMWGDSYYGFTQLAAVSTAHPALRAIAPRVTGTQLGALPMRRDGELAGDVEMAVARQYQVTFFQSNDSFYWEMDWSRRPFSAGVEEWFETIGERSPSYDLMTPHPVELRRFPAGHPFDAPAIPILQTIGFWDNCAPWQWADVELIKSRPAWQALEYLYLEPIDHENYDYDDVPHDQRSDHATSSEALKEMLPRYLDPALDFFDVFLRGERSADDIPRVRYRLGGDPVLRDAAVWPPPGAATETRYLVGRRLAGGPAEEESVQSWTHNPEALVPSPVQNAFAFLRESPDERSLAERLDVLAFESDALGDAVTFAGPVTLVLTIGSDGPQMDVFARLTHVLPEGAARLIARGQLVLHDASVETAVVVNMGHAGVVVPAGHRLRLTLASSDFPEFIPLPGTGEPRWTAESTKENVQSVRLGGEKGAALTFTTLPGGER